MVKVLKVMAYKKPWIETYYTEPFEKLGAYALIDESGKAYDALKKVLERNPIFKYEEEEVSGFFS